MIENADHQAPLDAGAVAEPVSAAVNGAVASRTGDLLPLLRRLVKEGERFNRASICRYMGMHVNTLQRLNDLSWHPRLDTLQKIETFLDRANDPAFRLEGAGWRLDYQADAWWVERGAKLQPRGPFDDPDTALLSGEAFEQETHIATQDH